MIFEHIKKVYILRLKKGILKRLSLETGIDARHLAGYASTCKRPGRKRAEFLERVTTALGFPVPKELWIFGTKEEIKAALMKGERRGNLGPHILDAYDLQLRRRFLKEAL